MADEPDQDVHRSLSWNEPQNSWNLAPECYGHLVILQQVAKRAHDSGSVCGQCLDSRAPQLGIGKTAHYGGKVFAVLQFGGGMESSFNHRGVGIVHQAV